MARNFTSGSSHRVNLSLGAGASITGAMTLAAIVKKASDGINETIFGIGNNNTTNRRLHIGTSNLPFVRVNNATPTSTGVTVTVADGWCFVCATKAVGTTTPRFHVFKYAANTWDHANAGTSTADSTPSGASGIGFAVTSNANFWDGDIAMCGAYAAALTDAQVESMAYGLPPWWQVSPNGLWMLDQSATAMLVNDLTGNGANQTALTGTAVSTSNVPVFSYGAPVTVQPLPGGAITPITDGDTGSGADAGESLAAALTDPDTGSGADAGESVVAAATDSDTAAATDAGEGIALADAETATGADAGESLAAAAADAETATAADAEALTVTTTDPDTGATTETEAIAAVGADADTGSGADAGESLAVAIADADAGTAIDAEVVGVPVTDADTGTATETEVLAVAVFDSDSGTVVDAELLGVTLTDADLAVIAEAEAIVAAVLDSETALAVDAGTVVEHPVGDPGCITLEISTLHTLAMTLSDLDKMTLTVSTPPTMTLTVADLGECTLTLADLGTMTLTIGECTPGVIPPLTGETRVTTDDEDRVTTDDETRVTA